MEKKDFLKILQRYKDGRASKEEEEFLFAYYELFDLEEDVLDQKTDAARDDLKKNIKDEIERKLQQDEFNPDENIRTPWTFYFKRTLAAMIIAAGLLGYFLYRPKPVQEKLPESLTKAESVQIVPGKNDAVLTLEDGKMIVLNEQNEGLVTQQAGVSITKTKEGQLAYEVTEPQVAVIHTIRTPRGGQYQITLEDGTRIWLNSASSIRFPTIFARDERIVEITGEAYLDVAHDSKKPFKVKSENQLVEVLGTQFNINTYPEEPLHKTTLISGSVKISKTGKPDLSTTGDSKILKPGQQAAVHPDRNKITLQHVDTEVAVAWKNGYFKFDKADIQTVMRQISRWYNVDVEYKGALSDDLFAGEIKRDEDVNKVLRILRLSNIRAEIQGKKIIISR